MNSGIISSKALPVAASVTDAIDLDDILSASGASSVDLGEIISTSGGSSSAIVIELEDGDEDAEIDIEEILDGTGIEESSQQQHVQVAARVIL
jgi:hypothetical protein